VGKEYMLGMEARVEEREGEGLEDEKEPDE
jgi:hypothetical protein